MTTATFTKDEQAYTLGKEAGKAFYGTEPNEDHYRHYKAISDLCTDEDDDRSNALAQAWSLGIRFSLEELAGGREAAIEQQAINLDPELPMEPENVQAFLEAEAEYAEQEGRKPSALTFLPLVNDAAMARNRDRLNGDEYPCLLCGKGCTPNGKAKAFLLGGGGVQVLTKEEYDLQQAVALASGQDQGLMGTYPIGPECYRKYRAVLAPYVQGAY